MMKNGNGCLTCRHVRLVAPPGWKPGYEGGRFDIMSAAKIIRETKRHLEAECTLNPVWIAVLTNHYCWQWKENYSNYGQSTDVEKFIWGTWDDILLRRLEKENKELKRQLKKSRDISGSRLARLKKNGAASAEPKAI